MSIAEMPDCNALPRQSLAQFAHKCERLRIVAVYAKRANRASSQHCFDLAHPLTPIMHKRLRLGARPQGAVWQIATIRETLGDELAATCAKCLEPRSRQAEQWQPKRSHCRDDGPGIGVLPASAIVQSAVRLDVPQFERGRACQGR